MKILGQLTSNGQLHNPLRSPNVKMGPEALKLRDEFNRLATEKRIAFEEASVFAAMILFTSSPSTTGTEFHSARSSASAAALSSQIPE